MSQVAQSMASARLAYPDNSAAASPAGASLGVGGVTVLCVFSGRATGLLADLRTSDPTAAIADAEAAEAALVGAG